MEQLSFDIESCACGCGQVTPLARFTNKAAGIIAGRPTKYIKGHARRMRIDKNGRQCGECGKYKPWADFHVSRTTRYGHMTTCKPCIKQKRHDEWTEKAKQARQLGNKPCECGCGEFTYLATKTEPANGWVKGQPLRYIRGHSRRGNPPKRDREAPAPKKPARSRQPDYERPRGGNLKTNYGITYTQYLAMVAAQCGACAICGEIPSADPDAHKKTSKLVVDHDHETGQVRDLLCRRCNLMLGQSGDDPARLLDGAMYLMNWKQEVGNELALPV